MKTAKLSLDFSDRPKLVETLRTYATATGKSQKQVVTEALTEYFADRMESRQLWRAAEAAFAEWDNAEDAVYDSL